MDCRLGASLCALPRRGHRGPQARSPSGTDPSEEGRLTNRGGVSFRATRMGLGVAWTWWLALLAEACGKVGQLDEGLRALEEALAAVQHNEEGQYEAEV